MTGKFITFEGGEGSGKSTQLTLLLETLQLNGLSCIKTREPGGSPGAEKIRALLVEGDKDAWDPLAEMLLFYAARFDHVQKIIKPALVKGTHVICDRFADSTKVYQGIGKGLPEKMIDDLHLWALGDFAPDLTLILDIDPVIGLKRALGRHGMENRFESMDIGFHQDVRHGFLALAQKEPKRCIVINAAKDKEKVHADIMSAVKRVGLA